MKDTSVIHPHVAGCWSRLQQFYWDLDHHRYDRIADYFAQEAILHRMGVPLKGIHNIETTLRRRDPDLATRHVLYTPLVAESSEQTLKLNGYMQVLRKATDPGCLVRPVPLQRPWRMYDVHVEFVDTPQGWTMNELLMEPVFEFIADSAPVD